jgi:hypothetical protein
MANPAGESNAEVLRLDFDRRLMLQFRGSDANDCRDNQRLELLDMIAKRFPDPCRVEGVSDRSSRGFVRSRTNSSTFSGGTPIVTDPIISRPAAAPPGADTVWSAPPGPANKTKAKIEPHSAAREGTQYRDMLLK